MTLSKNCDIALMKILLYESEWGSNFDHPFHSQILLASVLSIPETQEFHVLTLLEP
jgi:hypothetical protein